ncbi:MAG TPA: FAD-dependent oxidoreductase, partial [Candidatus Krumholzibacteria bacterium]|nr:FAD-dependent oxidoreductase [Candidatus Krumholzibacteria bacterium]
MKQFDAIVVGLGAMGSAALYHLARRGARVAGFDTYTPPHALGSSHGETRMIREAYYEDTRYVPLLRRSYDLWHEIAREAGNELLVETGAVYAGPPEGELIAGILRAGQDHNISITELSGSTLSTIAPWLRVPDNMVAVAEPRGGYLHPERCIESHLRLAADLGAEVHNEEPVEDWQVDGDSVVVETGRERYAASRLVLTPGAGITDWLANAGVRTTVVRQPMFW